MVSRLNLVKNLIFHKKFIRISLVIIQMKTKNIKNKLNCENIDMKKLSITELKHLKNQAKSLTDKRIKENVNIKYGT